MTNVQRHYIGHHMGIFTAKSRGSLKGAKRLKKKKSHFDIFKIKNEKKKEFKSGKIIKF